VTTPAWLLTIGWIGFGLLALAAIGLIVTSMQERRWRPVRIGLPLLAGLLAALAALLLLEYAGKAWIVSGVVMIGLLGVALLALPIGIGPKMRIPGPRQRVDERDAIFHRFYRLRPGSPEFDEYYRAHPDKLEFDEKVRGLPPLASPASKTYDALGSPFQVAIFEVLENATREIDWPPEPLAGKPVEASAEEFSRRVKGFARYLGADLVGTTRLNPANVYSHIGRSPGPWGAPITLDHTHAIAIGVEMSHEMVRHGPDSPTTTETAFKYFEAAKVAVLVARYINRLGYEARAHVDGNYRVLCGPIAVDAGLGELGRLGLLMTPKFGPRLRLAVVTTNLPLVQDEPVHFGVQDFCEFCKKCAENCPSGSIDAGKKALHNGVEKWQSDQESCYRFWRLAGSDCSVCVRVCPYSHPATFMHNLVRWAIRRNALARRVALWADDLFYGRRPMDDCPPPDWHARG